MHTYISRRNRIFIIIIIYVAMYITDAIHMLCSLKSFSEPLIVSLALWCSTLSITLYGRSNRPILISRISFLPLRSDRTPSTFTRAARTHTHVLAYNLSIFVVRIPSRYRFTRVYFCFFVRLMLFFYFTDGGFDRK